MKRNLLITVLITFLLLIAGLFVSKHDSIKYKNVMNRNGVSEEALILETKSDKRIIDALQELNKTNKLSYRMHFISKKNPNLSYFYGKNEKVNLPIESGRNFSALDFSAAVPFVIAGKDVQNIIKPQEQSYVFQNGSYLPVIGNVEMDGKSNLNKHIFTSISPKMENNNEKISDYQVILDGVYTHKSKTIKVVMDAFHASKTANSTNRINNVKQNIFEKNSVEFFILVLITILVIILNFNLIVPMKYSINNSQLHGDLKNDFKIGFIFLFALYNIVAFSISYIVINNWILIINRTPLNTFFIVNIVLTILLGCYIIFADHRRLLRKWF